MRSQFSSLAFTLLLACTALSAPLGACAAPAPNFHDHGQITAVDSSHNRIQFTDDQGAAFLIDTTGSTVTLPGPQPSAATVEDLVAGMVAEIDGVQSGKLTASASQIKVLPYIAQPEASPADIPGVPGTNAMLQGILTGGAGFFDRTIRVSVHGREVKVDVPKGIAVQIDGSPASVHALPKGDPIIVTGVWEPGGNVRADHVIPAALKGTRVRGTSF